jgi:hypothetical protein
MACATSFSLLDESDAGYCEGFPNAICLMADHGEDIPLIYNPAGSSDDMGQQRLTADFVKHFWAFGIEPRSFAGCQNYNRQLQSFVQDLAASLAHYCFSAAPALLG